MYCIWIANMGGMGGWFYEDMKSRKGCAALYAVYRERKKRPEVFLHRGGSFVPCEGGRKRVC